MNRKITSRDREGRRSTIRGRRWNGRGWLRPTGAARSAAFAVAPWLLLAACGGADDAAQPELEVNPVEAMMAIDDVRVAGMPLASRTPAGPSARAGDATPAAAPAAGGPVAWPQVAHLQPGAPLDVDMMVADATAGSEVGIVWSAPDGREVWRQKQVVGDEPRLAFTADTTGWPAGLYRGAIHYGRVPVHQFAVQVGAPPAPTFGRERIAGQPPDAGEDGGVPAPLDSRATSPAGSPAPTVGGEATAAREATAAAAPSAPRVEAAEPAAAAPVERVPAEAVPSDVVPAEGVPVERIPDEDPNLVVPEGPAGPAPEPDADDAADDDDDDPPPAGLS